MTAIAARDELKAHIDEYKAEIAQARARDRVRRERYSAALQAAEQAVREHAARVLPCERFGHIPEPPRGLMTWPAEPIAEVQETAHTVWHAVPSEVAEAGLKASLQQIEQVQSQTVAVLDQVAHCAKCRFFFRCLALTWLYRR